MLVRKMCLPTGWYPHNKDDAAAFISANGGCALTDDAASRAAVAPHAGWFFSGTTALRSISALNKSADTVIVAGGHLGSSSKILAAGEDGAQTPFGVLPIDAELREELKKETDAASDKYADNSVEVLLPFVHYFFPRSKILYVRFPANMDSFHAGQKLAASAQKLNKNAVFIASTDLTHYGGNYDFTPHGGGKAALEWVKTVNDNRFIDAVLSFDEKLVLKRAVSEMSACSPGAVLAALGFAGALGCRGAELISYTTSADVMNAEGYESPDSFVGYAAMKVV